MVQETGVVMSRVSRQVQEEKEVSQQVQARLKRADDLEKSVQELTNSLDEANCKLGEQALELKALRELDLRAKDLEKREQLLVSEQVAFDQRKEFIDFKLEAEKIRVADHQKMLELTLRNQTIRRTMLSPVAVDGGSYMQSDNHGTNQVMQSPGTVQTHTSHTSEVAE